MKTGNTDLDHLNHETLMRLFKKCNNFQINRIEKTFEILEILGANGDSLDNLEGLHVEMQFEYFSLLKNLYSLKNLTKLSLA
jgi:hypothetical protein